MGEKITSAKKCRRDTMILLFTSAFAECRRELERLPYDFLMFSGGIERMHWERMS